MRDYAYYAKREELGETSLNLEKAQAEIKYVIKQAISMMATYGYIDKIIDKIIEKYTEGIKDEELKKKAKKSLKDYSKIEYRRMKELLQNMNLLLLSQFLVLIKKTSTIREKEKALKIIISDSSAQKDLLWFVRKSNSKKENDIFWGSAVEDNRNVPVASISATRFISTTQSVERKILYGDVEYIEIAQPLGEYAETYIRRVKEAWKELAESEAKDSYGEHVSLRNIAEMTERYERKQEELQSLIDQGVDLVYISTHANCSKRCEPWQGKLYSISGRSGVIDGVPFQPLSNATDNYYTTKAGKTYRNGCISGFNCRHRLTKYSKGSKPIQVSAKTIERAREINDTQRKYERKIRDSKALAIGLKDVDPQKAKEYRLRAKALTEEYESYSRKNEVAFYPSRCKVFDGEELISARYKRLLSVSREKISQK